MRFIRLYSTLLIWLLIPSLALSAVSTITVIKPSPTAVTVNNTTPPVTVIVPGAQGIQGPKGADSTVVGPQGIQGIQGIQGLQGATGAQGPTGLTGLTGDTGPTGATGPQGLKGDTGDIGPQGPAGTAGAQGPQGIQGAAGAAGATGAQVTQGIQGPTGADGLTTSVDGIAQSSGNVALKAVRVLAQSAVASSVTGTLTPTALMSYTLPANIMGFNGKLRISYQLEITGNTNIKNIKLNFGTETANSDSMSAASQVSYTQQKTIINQNSKTAQVAAQYGYASSFGSSAATYKYMSQDTAATVAIALVATLFNVADTIKLVDYTIELLPGVN